MQRQEHDKNNKYTREGGCKSITSQGSDLIYRFGGKPVSAAECRAAAAAGIVLLVAALFCFQSATAPLVLKAPNTPANALVREVKVSSSQELIESLVNHNLWSVESNAEVHPVVFSRYPEDLHELETGDKKKAFLHALLPVALVAVNEVEQERAALLSVLTKIQQDIERFPTADNARQEFPYLAENDYALIEYLAEKYSTRDKDELLSRVNVVPVSLILAQGALESSWGGSRFAQEGNNLFGVRTWNEDGILPLGRDSGDNHRLSRYSSLLDSVRHYLLLINRLDVYKDLRFLRESTMDPMVLADGLFYYSERGDEYIRDVQQLIRYNNLNDYDGCSLFGQPLSPSIPGVQRLAMMSNEPNAVY